MSENKVKWHPYPKEKPKSYLREHLVTVESYLASIPLKKIEKDTWIDSEDGGEWLVYGNKQKSKIIAWTELPEPYEPEQPEDNHPDAITARNYAERDPETVKALHIFDE